MNKHEEARKRFNNLVRVEMGGISFAGYGISYSVTNAIEDCNFVNEYLKQAEATEKELNRVNLCLDQALKELEEIKNMIRFIGGEGISFDTSHQRVVFESLMNKIGRLQKVGEEE